VLLAISISPAARTEQSKFQQLHTLPLAARNSNKILNKIKFADNGLALRL
jgi:hypothetical protein